MHEILLNLHMHTRYSDGSGLHADLAQAALQAGVDVILVTDHNVLASQFEGYTRRGRQQVLTLIGEEIHDQARQPQKNHLLVFNARRELATFAHDPQTLIDAVRREGGLSFLAHPTDQACPAVHETAIDWVDWQVQGYTGLELWNGLSEFKSVSPGKLQAYFHAFFPQWIARGPDPALLARWDELLAAGKKVAAIGGSDAHALIVRAGPLRREIFPYAWHFRTINTHLLIAEPLNGDLAHDRAQVYEALGRGRAFVGYDLPAPTRGFRFSAHSRQGQAEMGEEISAAGGLTLQARLPRPALGRLLKDGKVVRSWRGREALIHNSSEPGVYRVEAYLNFLGRRRGWIFSNPIYVLE
ncbi:MAG: CehA/McbA family metallohydrolase [Anaerolineales bacterium]